MAKKVLAIGLVLSLVFSLVVLGAKKPQDVRISNNLDRERNESVISKYLLPQDNQILYPISHDTVGYTYWDYQYNVPRMIALDDSGKLHFTWTNLWVSDTSYDNRYVYYNSKRKGVGPPTYGWLVHNGKSVTQYNAWFSGLDILPDSREVLYYTKNDWGATVSIEDSTPGSGQFNDFDIPDSIENSEDKEIRSLLTTPKNTPSYSPLMQIVVRGKNSNCEDQLAYVSCSEKEGNKDILICQSPELFTNLEILKNTRLAPNNKVFKFASTLPYGNVSMATSKISQKICIAWLDYPTGCCLCPEGYKGQVVYLESTNNGKNWEENGEIMKDPIRIGPYWLPCYSILASYDLDDELHLTWETLEIIPILGPTPDYGYERTIWHWSSGTNKVSKAYSHFYHLSSVEEQFIKTYYAKVLPSYAIEALALVTGFHWLVLVDAAIIFLDISGEQKDEKDIIYPKGRTEYPTGGNLAEVNYAFDDTSAKGKPNLDLYMIVSSNGGLSWGPPINLTDTHSPGCPPGQCSSEVSPSVAEVADSFVYIQYIMDRDAGCAILGEGEFTRNPVRYLKYPVPSSIPAVPRMDYDPRDMTEPIRCTVNNGSTVGTMRFDNMGTATLYVKTDAPTASYVTLTPANFNILESGDAVNVVVDFSAAGLSDTILYDSIRVASNHWLLGGAESYVDTQWVHFIFLVTDSPLATEWDTVDTHAGGIKTVLSNTGNFGHGGVESGVQMNYNGKDYLFDCSPLLVTTQATGSPDDTIAASWLHDRVDFFSESHLQVAQQPEFATWGITIATSSFAPMVRRLGNPYHWFWWWWTIEQKDVFFENERVIVKYVRLYKNPPPPWWRAISVPYPQPSVLFGIGADWDVPSEAFERNKGGYNPSSNLIYVYSDSVGFTNNYAGFYFYYASVDDGYTHDTVTAPYAARVQRNQTQMYPFRGYNDDSLYKYMSIPGFSVEQDSSQDMDIIISAINPTKLSGLSATALVTAKYALVVSETGLPGLLKPMCGNANRDQTVSVSDVVYLVNYLFKSGPRPFMYYSNANGDNKISVADVVYLVNYLFKGGAKPICNYPIPLP